MSDPDLDELAAELSEFDVPEKKGGRSPDGARTKDEWVGQSPYDGSQEKK